MIEFKSEKFVITPTEPVCLSGYGNSNKYTSIADDLEINIIILKQKKTEFCFISADLLFLSDDFCSLVQKKTKLPKANIFIASTHTHSAPGIDKTKFKLGKVNDQYSKNVLNKLSIGIENLSKKKYNEVLLEYFSTKINGTVSRRRRSFIFTKKIIPIFGMYIYPNPIKPVDKTCHFILIKDLNKKVISCIWQFACHPVCNPYKLSVSSDFPGKIRNKLRIKFGKIPIIYYQGFSGDIRPMSYDKSNTLKIKILKFLNNGILPFNPFGFYNNREYENWIEQFFLSIERKLHNKSKKINPNFSSENSKISLKKVFNNLKGDRAIEINAIKISEDIILLGISAEVCNDFKNIFPTTKVNIIKVGCTNYTFGYLPSEKMLNEGGYEVDGWIKPFGYNGTFNKNIEATIKETVKNVLKKLPINF